MNLSKDTMHDSAHSKKVTELIKDGDVTYFVGPTDLLSRHPERNYYSFSSGAIDGAEKIFEIFAGECVSDVDKSGNCVMAFMAKWCHHCNYEVESFLKSKKMIKKMLKQKKVKAHYLCEESFNPMDAVDFNIEWFPQFVTFCNGKLKSVLFGPVTPDQFVQFINQSFCEASE